MQRILCLGLFMAASLLPGLAGSLNGRVTSGGQGVGFATILVADQETLCPAGQGFADGSGNYDTNQFGDIPNGDYYVFVLALEGDIAALGYAGTDGLDLGNAVPVTINGATNFDIDIPEGGSISGRVTTSNLPAGLTASVVILDPVGLVPITEFSSVVNTENNGNYTATGLPDGCYVVGAGIRYSNDDLSISPVVFYDGHTQIRDASLITIENGNAVSGIDFNLDGSQLGRMEVTLNGSVSGTSPSLSVVGSNVTFFDRDFDGSSTFLLLPPDDYRVSVRFTDRFVEINDSTVRTINAGQTLDLSYTPMEGGKIAGDVSFNPELTPFAGFVMEAIDTQTGELVGSTLAEFNPLSPVPYEIDRLPSGSYYVRYVAVTAFAGLGVSSNQYYDGSVSIAGATPVSVSAPNTTGGIDFTLTPGGSISGAITRDGQTLLAQGLFVSAIETTTNETFLGFVLDGEYTVSGLPAGSYKLAVNTFPSTDSDFGTIVTNPIVGCANIAPSFHPNASTFSTAATVNVPDSGVLENINIDVTTGGGISGKIVSQDCQCSVNTGLIAVFEGNEFRRAGLVINGTFLVAGLPSGTYELRISKFFAGALDNVDLDDIEDELNFANLFSGDNAFVFGSPVTVTRNQYNSIGEWCIPLEPLGEGGGNSNDFEDRLLYPWVSNREGSFESILVVNNPSDQAINVRLTATRGDGQTSAPVTRNIPARGFLEESAASLFQDLGSGSGYSVLLASPSADVRGGWVTNSLAAPSGESPSQGVAVRVDGTNNSRIGEQVIFGYLPVTNNAISAPVVVNLGDGPQDVQLTFFDAAGTQVGNSTIEDLAPYRPFAALANNLVPQGSGDVYMVAEGLGDEDVTGVSFVFDASFNEPAIGNVSSIDTDGSGRLFYPWVSNRANQFESIVVANNYGNSAATVTLTATRGDGQTSAPVTRNIPAGGALQETAASLFPDLGDGAGYNVLLEANVDTIQGQWVTNNVAAASGGSPSQGVAIDIGDRDEERSDNDILFSYLPTTGAFISAPVVVNSGSQATDVTLRFYDASGNLVATDTTTLQGIAPGVPFAAVANSLIPAGSGNLYMVASSDDQPLTGVAFVFNADFSEPAIGNATAIDFDP